MSSPILLDVRQLSSLLGVSVRTTWKLSSRGDIPAPIRLGRSVRWTRESIEQWVRDKQQGASHGELV